MQPGDGAAWHSGNKIRNSRAWAAKLKWELSRATEPASGGGFSSSVLCCGTGAGGCAMPPPWALPAAGSSHYTGAGKWISVWLCQGEGGAELRSWVQELLLQLDVGAGVTAGATSATAQDQQVLWLLLLLPVARWNGSTPLLHETLFLAGQVQAWTQPGVFQLWVQRAARTKQTSACAGRRSNALSRPWDCWRLPEASELLTSSFQSPLRPRSQWAASASAALDLPQHQLLFCRGWCMGAIYSPFAPVSVLEQNTLV